MAENTAKNQNETQNEVITSPEQLNDYLKVTNPRIWAVFVVILLIMLAFIAWSCAGTIRTFADAKAVVSDGKAQLIVVSMESGTIEKGMTVGINGEDFQITEVEEDEYGRTVAYAPVSLLDGSYDAKIVTETITPISFLLRN